MTGRRNASGHRLGGWHQCAKEPDELVIAVLRDYQQGVRGRGYRALAKKYTLAESTVRDWCTFRTRASA